MLYFEIVKWSLRSLVLEFLVFHAVVGLGFSIHLFHLNFEYLASNV